MGDGSALRQLGRWSRLKVICLCDSIGCKRIWVVNYFHVSQRDQHLCRSCASRVGALKIRHRLGVKWTDEEKRRIGRAVQQSEKFRIAVQSADYKAMVSRTSTGRFHSKATKQNLSRIMMGNHHSHGESGGKCKWYTIEVDGKIVKVQGTWELAYARYLTSFGIQFVAHPKPPIMYIDKDGKSHRYYPDFFLLDTKEYIDVKNVFCIKQDKGKIAAIKAEGIKLRIVTKENLVALGCLLRGHDNKNVS
jgi:hypothetical protein